MMSKALIARKMNVQAAQAWEAIAAFGRLDVWFPSLASCRIEGEGVNAHRYMTIEDGGEIIDRLVSVDSENRRLVYNRIKSPFPVTSYIGTVEIFESFDSLAVVVWTVDFESEPEHSKPVASRLEASIGAGVAGMAADLMLQRPST
jgi:Polyketide cyclase / dehydrase and lipid transport